jgi:hypothetical protein
MAGQADWCLGRLRPGPAREVVRPEGAAVVSCVDECLRVSPAAGDESGDVGGELVDDGARRGDRSPSGLCLRRAKLDVSWGSVSVSSTARIRRGKYGSWGA